MSYKNVSYVGIALLVVGPLLVASAQAALIPPSGNIIWLDAQDLHGDSSPGPADGTPVATWVDKSGIAVPNDFASVGESPGYYNGVINGNAAVRFVARGDNLVSPWTLKYGAWTNFAVVKVNTGSNLLWERMGNDNLGMSSSLGGDATTILTIRPEGIVGLSNAAADWGNIPVDPTPGDANTDGTVDSEDAVTLANNWQGTGKSWSDGDFNGDSKVDDIDATILATNWLKTSGAASVPEPGAIALLFGACLAILPLLRRKAR